MYKRMPSFLYTIQSLDTYNTIFLNSAIQKFGIATRRFIRFTDYTKILNFCIQYSSVQSSDDQTFITESSGLLSVTYFLSLRINDNLYSIDSKFKVDIPFDDMIGYHNDKLLGVLFSSIDTVYKILELACNYDIMIILYEDKIKTFENDIDLLYKGYMLNES